MSGKIFFRGFCIAVLILAMAASAFSAGVQAEPDGADRRVLDQEYLDRYTCPVVPRPTPRPHTGSNSGVTTSSVIPFQATAAQGTVHLRAAAGTSATLLATLPAGGSVRVIGQTTGADRKVWYQVQFGTAVGYIRYDQVQVQCGTAEFGGKTDPVGPCVGQTNMPAVNVRLGMSVNTARVRQLRRGQTFTILALAHDYLGTPWYYVCIPSGAIGYIRGEYVTVVSGVVAETLYQPTQAGTLTYDPATGFYGLEGWDGTGGVPTAAPEQEAEEKAQEDHGEELIYLRWLNTHMDDFASIGSGYQGYSLYDLDGDGIREALVSCGADTLNRWQIYTCVQGEVVDLGQIASNGYYLSGEGSGLLLINVISDSQTQYTRVEKVENSLVVMYTLVRTADDNWRYTWSYNQAPISTDALLQLLHDFTDDVLQNMGLYQGQPMPDAAAPTQAPGDTDPGDGGNG